MADRDHQWSLSNPGGASSTARIKKHAVLIHLLISHSRESPHAETTLVWDNCYGCEDDHRCRLICRYVDRIAPGQSSVVAPDQIGSGYIAINTRSVCINNVDSSRMLTGLINRNHGTPVVRNELCGLGGSSHPLPMAVKANSRLGENLSSARPFSRTLIQPRLLF